MIKADDFKKDGNLHFRNGDHGTGFLWPFVFAILVEMEKREVVEIM